MPMAVRYAATKPMFLSLVRPERISSPMTRSPAVTIAVSLSDLPSAAPVMAASPPSRPPLARHATRLKDGAAAAWPAQFAMQSQWVFRIAICPCICHAKCREKRHELFNVGAAKALARPRHRLHGGARLPGGRDLRPSGCRRPALESHPDP